MREIRKSGSEGGAAQQCAVPTPIPPVIGRAGCPQHASGRLYCAMGYRNRVGVEEAMDHSEDRSGQTCTLEISSKAARGGVGSALGVLAA